MLDIKGSVDNSIGAFADLFLQLETWPAFSLLLFELLLFFLRLRDLLLGHVGHVICGRLRDGCTFFIFDAGMPVRLLARDLLLLVGQDCGKVTGTTHNFFCYLID